jgi:3-hydroxymyristoyl/3-hydroxydecanoyl-(acyl carrier protein) dehydratase
MNRAAIEAAIPHRAPFLFLDAIVEHDPDASDGAPGVSDAERWLLAEWTVPANGAWFAGHFPGQPVTPGVLLAEHAFQAAAVLISRALGGFSAADGVPVVTRIADARYRRRVAPGETLRTRVEVEERVGPAWYLRARVACGTASVATFRFVLTATGAIGRIGV